MQDKKVEKLSKPRQATSIPLQIASHIFYTLGLLATVVLYSIIGGFVFGWLERENERLLKISGREKIDALTQKTATEIYTELEKLGHSGASSRDKVLEYLEATTWTYFHEAWKLKKDGTWDGTYTEDGDVVQEWTFIGSLLFSATTITAIGYGNIAPKTTTGRITCIFYSIFGLPLTMICIANIGIWFAKQVRLIHKKLSMCFRKSVTSDVQEVPVVFSVLTMVSYIFVGAWIFYSWENWSVIKGAYFCFITLSTIGYGDIVPDVYRGGEAWHGKSSVMTSRLIVFGLYLFFGLALLTMCMNLMKEEVKANFIWLGRKFGLKSDTKNNK